MRACNKCGDHKPLNDFARNAKAKDGLHPWCKPCKASAARAWYANTKPARRVQHRSKHLESAYGITDAQYALMLAGQAGVCALCGRPPKKYRLSIDHDHSTRRVRALLCNHCNRRRVSDHTLETARHLVAYLENHA